MRRKIIFIGGPSASAKTTLAKKVGQHLGLPWLSADHIHDMSLMIGNRELSPETFRVRDYSAENFYKHHTIDEVVQSEIAISHETWRGIKALVESGFEGIIEGVAVIPSLVILLKDEDISVRAAYLSNEDSKEILKIAQERGIWDAAHMYSDDMKPKEVEFALAYNEYLKEEAVKYGYPIVPVERASKDFENILKALGEEFEGGK